MREFIIIIITQAVFFISLFNDSLSEYYEQRYHKTLNIDNLYLKKFSEFRSYLEYNVFYTKTKSTPNTTALDFKLQCYLPYAIAKSEPQSQAIMDLSKGVILLGDSLMQGAGIAICNELRKKSIKCENLAKQSTGLLRKKYYDYAKVLEDFLSTSDIKNIVILVGVNDLWDVSDNKKLLKFGKSEWREFYGKRVDELAKIARKNFANIFWYELPVVKNDEQNEKIKILNEVFFEQARKNNYRFIKLDSALTEHFDFYIKIEGKSKKIRSNDGIHFTPLGYRLISQDFFKTVQLR